MSDTNTNTNTNTNNSQNWNQNSGRGGLDQGDITSGGRGNCCTSCGNTTIVKYSFEGKMKEGLISK